MAPEMLIPREFALVLSMNWGDELRPPSGGWAYFVLPKARMYFTRAAI